MLVYTEKTVYFCFVKVWTMEKVIKISSESKLAKILAKMVADKKVINNHIANGGHLADLKGKIGFSYMAN